MPAEMINDQTNPEWRAQVHWGRDRPVRVSTVCLTSAPLDVKSNVPVTGTQHTWEGVFVALDREGCNRMIRALRKARDQAYGQDA